MHPLRVLSTVILGLYGCVAIPYGVVLAGNSQLCNQQLYSITGTNTTYLWPPECPPEHHPSSFTTGVVLLATGSVSIIAGCLTCMCSKKHMEDI